MAKKKGNAPQKIKQAFQAQDIEDPEEEVEVPGQSGGLDSQSAEEKQFVSKPVAFGIVLVLVVVILFLGILFLGSMKNTLNKSGTRVLPVDYGTSIAAPEQEWNQTYAQSCLEKYGIDAKTPIFCFLPTCPYCKEMMPIVTEVEKRGHSFRMADRSDSAVSKMLYECFGGIVQNSVPQLICPANLKEKTGLLTENEIVAFAENCRK